MDWWSNDLPGLSAIVTSADPNEWTIPCFVDGVWSQVTTELTAHPSTNLGRHLTHIATLHDGPVNELKQWLEEWYIVLAQSHAGDHWHKPDCVWRAEF